MKKTTKNTGIKVTTGVKAGGWSSNMNHTTRGLKITSGLKAGAQIYARNHAGTLATIA
jgi:hypothetical protein